MANATRTRARTSQSTPRGRFARPGTTQTSPRPRIPRPGGTATRSTGRFPRPIGTATRSTFRTPPRPRIPGRRPKPTGMQAVFAKLPGMGGGAGKAGSGNRGKFGAAALLAGAAGFALRNRDKLPGPLGRKGEGTDTQPVGAPPEHPHG